MVYENSFSGFKSRPRNHRYLQREGLGFWGPLALYGSASIAARIPSSSILSWPSAEVMSMASTRLRSASASTRVSLEGLSQGHHLPGVQVDDLPMEQRRRLVGGLDVQM
jgi:hypothetical protein